LPPLSKREREFVLQLLHNKKSSNQRLFSNDQQYDLNYRLKLKFQAIHEDYWLLVKFFKTFEDNFALRSTKRTKKVLSIAKSQIANELSVVKARCHFCLRDNSTIKENRLLEIIVCKECIKQL
jgi:hypothetical protein